jgi:hypothetical protein
VGFWLGFVGILPWWLFATAVKAPIDEQQLETQEGGVKPPLQSL